VMNGGAASPTPLAYIYLTLTEGPTKRVTQLLSGIASYQGDKLTGFASGQGLNDLVSGLVNTAVSFVQAIFEEAWAAPLAADIGAAAISAGRSAQNAADAVSGTTKLVGPSGLEVETEILMTSGEALSLGLGAVALIALFPLQALAKKTTDQVRVYNATSEALDVSLAWLHPEAGYAGPLAIEPVTLSAVGPVWTPPWVIGENAASYANWIFNNTDTLGRIAYVVHISASRTFPGALVEVDIPNHDDNSAGIGFTTSEDFKGFWESCPSRTTALVASEQSSIGGYVIRLATNQTNGESPSPADGTMGYNYEHLIVIEPAT